MKRVFCLASMVCLFISGCLTPQRDIVFQTSTIDALLAGVYDGDISCHLLLKHGDFGIGTFDCLDGEMVMLDGVIYQVTADGKVHEADPSIKTPFATACYFNPEKNLSINAGTDFEGIEKLIDQTASNQNLFCAIKVTGQFKTMRTRSVPRQNKPYPPLKEVTMNQPEFNMEDVAGTIVGFRCPVFVKGVNVPGYHLHFINCARTQGGHILSFELTSGNCELDILNQYFLRLPEDTKGFAEADLSRDTSKELKDVEKGDIKPEAGNSN
jgi:acetolactate decarboxylase